MGQIFEKSYIKINDNEDDALFRDLLIGNNINQVNIILSQKDFYYHNTLIKDVCDGECSDYCDHILIVDIEDGLITDFFLGN